MHQEQHTHLGVRQGAPFGNMLGQGCVPGGVGLAHCRVDVHLMEGARLFCPMMCPTCLCEPVVPMFEGGLREVTTDKIETTLGFDGLRYGGLLETADCLVT